MSEDAEVFLWNEAFTFGRSFFETLVDASPNFDFAILVLTADDLIQSRNDEILGPRENVIFELGLFTGRLGRSRTFIVHQANTQSKIPTDLSGVATAQFSWPRHDNNHKAAVGPACDVIRNVIRELGVSEAKTEMQVGDLRSHQKPTGSRLRTIDIAPSRIFGEPQQHNQWPDVFVLMPFNNALRPVYEDHIQEVMTRLQLRVARADNFFTNDSIMADIWSAINAALIIIADCTGRNPNVFYEVGIAHALGK